jgi:hypothetical protein
MAVSRIMSIVLEASAFILSGKPPEKEFLRRLYIIIPGATPKLTTSARLSSSLPITEYAFSNLAENPSRKSKIIAASISHDAVTVSPVAAKMTAANPDVRLSEVIKLGIYLIIE